MCIRDRAKVLAAGGEPVKKARGAVAKATAAHDEAESAVVQAGVDLKDSHKAAEKATKAAAEADADLAALEKRNAKVMEEFSDVEVIIYLTDLEAAFDDFGDEPPVPVLWVSTDKNGKAPWGEVVYLGE